MLLTTWCAAAPFPDFQDASLLSHMARLLPHTDFELLCMRLSTHVHSAAQDTEPLPC